MGLPEDVGTTTPNDFLGTCQANKLAVPKSIAERDPLHITLPRLFVQVSSLCHNLIVTGALPGYTSGIPGQPSCDGSPAWHPALLCRYLVRKSQFDSFDSDEESLDPIDELHIILDCPSYTYARQLFPDIFGSNIVTFSQFLNQPDCNRVARFLTWPRQMRMNLAWSDESARP